jgi:uncharacterized membrane protein
MEIKPGYQTTEFWVTILPFVLLIVKQFTGVELEQDVIVNGILGLFGVISAIAYIISRFKLKTKAMDLENK